MVDISISEKIEMIRQDIGTEVKLVAVSKTKPNDFVMEAYNVGQRDFGENKVQELREKMSTLPKDIKWHFIGKLQTNKVKYLVENVELIHTLSSLKLLLKIESEFAKVNKKANVLIQINIGREENKNGILEEELDDLIEAIEKCSFVAVKGIMVILPKGDEESNRYYFKRSRDIFNTLKEKNYTNIKAEILSMGMSGDYKIAVEEGSNLVRVGSGIFGTR